jgi:hypothetical protein
MDLFVVPTIGFDLLHAFVIVRDEPPYEATARTSTDSILKRIHLAHQGRLCDKSGTVEIGRIPLDSRAAAAIAGSGTRIGGTAW